MPEQVKSERLQRLQALLGEQQQAFNAACAGQTMPVLFDRRGRAESQLVGRSPFLQSVHIDNAPGHLFGRLVDVVIEEGHRNSLRGCLRGDVAASA